nr:T9SS type A sorting domain-containing protein [Bacteroidota bacterium]
MTSNSIYSPNGGTNYNFYRYDEDLDYWIIYGATGDPEAFGDTEFGAAKGYCVTRNGEGTVSFTGTVRTSNTSYAATYTADKGEGWNLVGNPFTSSIGVSSSATTTGKFIGDNAALLDDSWEGLFIWDEQSGYTFGDNDYKVISNSSISGYTQISQNYIQPGQGFMVKVVSGGGDVVFNTNMQTHDAGTFHKREEQWPTFELAVTGMGESNITAIGFNENMSTGLDPSFDVGKLKGNPNIALYTKLIDDNGIDFAVQALPLFEQNYSVPVGLDIATAGEYMLNLATLDQIPEKVNIYFEDKLTGSVIDFRKFNSYACMINEEGSHAERFILHFTLTPFGTGEISSEEVNLQIWSTNNLITILNPDKLSGEVRIINLLGQEMLSTQLNGDSRQVFEMNMIKGCYIVNISGDSSSINRKIFIK